MPQIKRRWLPETKQEVFRLIDAGHSQGEVEKLTGVPQATISRWLKERLAASGDSEHTNGIPAVYHGETGGVPAIPGIPVTPDGIPEVQWRNTIESRLDVIEAFLAAAQQRAHGIPVTPESIPALALPSGPPTPTKKHSFVIAIDLLDHINAYAEAHHLEIKAVLDLALRNFFAGEGTGDA